MKVVWHGGHAFNPYQTLPCGPSGMCAVGLTRFHFGVENFARVLSLVSLMLQPTEPAAPFDAFRKIFLARPALLEQLRSTPDVAAFVVLVRATAEQHGFQLTSEEIHAALRASRQAWIERWI
jgi:hypothetical protein